MPLCWEVVGGADKGGILVRDGKELASPAQAERLSMGALVEQLALAGDRLQYRLLEGTGPKEGWVSLKVGGKDLLVPHGDRGEAEISGGPALVPPPAGNGAAPDSPSGVRAVVGPGAGYRVRLAVNIDDWAPVGEADGPEFQYLLGLIREDDDRASVMRFKFLEDKKRALMSRLLVRAAGASALGLTSFKGLTVKRTKGRKPFVASPLPPVDKAPNWNVNVSHEGSWVVCASEPVCVAGIDVAELRRLKKNGEPIDFHKSFKDHLTPNEWRDVAAAGEDLDAQYEVFSRFWSAKESFVKARGDGLAFDLGKAEFRWTPLAGFPDGTAYEGTVSIEGQPASPLWRFVQHRMPTERPHWTTVARGPVAAVVDAHGAFLATLRRPEAGMSPEEWQAALAEDSPPCAVVPVGALVPLDDMEGFVQAGGTRWP